MIVQEFTMWFEQRIGMNGFDHRSFLSQFFIAAYVFTVFYRCLQYAAIKAWKIRLYISTLDALQLLNFQVQYGTALEKAIVTEKFNV